MILEDWPGRADPFFVGYDVAAGRIAFERDLLAAAVQP